MNILKEILSNIPMVNWKSNREGYMTAPNVFLSTEIINWQRLQAVVAGRDTATITDGQFRYLRLKEVIGLCGISERAIYRGIKSGTFPTPIKLKL
jgi:hypothetical protein